MNKKSAMAWFQSIPKPVSIGDASAREMLYLQTRQTGQGLFALLWNKSRTRSLHQVPIDIPEGLSAQLWDCGAGERRQVETPLRLDFAPGQERVLYLSNQKEMKEFLLKPSLGEPVCPRLTGYRLDEPNVLPLDRAALYLEGRLLEEGEILCLDRQLRLALGLETRSGEAVQPWARAGETPMRVPIKLRWRVTMEKIPQEPIRLAMEPLPEAAIWINGIPVPLEETADRWVDSCFRVCPLPREVWKQGENILELTGCYGADCGLEAMFLLGQFGVWLREGRPHIGALPPHLHPGNLVSQGLPFYGGKVRYDYAAISQGRYLLRMPKIGGACAVARWGNQSRTLLWPWQEVTLSLETGQEWTLEVVLTRRNTFGPLQAGSSKLRHHPRRKPHSRPSEYSLTKNELADYDPRGHSILLEKGSKP